MPLEDFNVSEFLEVKLNKKLHENPESVEDFYCVYQLEIGEGIWHLDLTASKEKSIKAGAHAAPDCTIKISREDFYKILKRELNVVMAVMTGKLKVSGDKTLALKIGSLFK